MRDSQEPLVSDGWKTAPRKKKNTKKWCKGKVGVEHKPVVKINEKILLGRRANCELFVDNDYVQSFLDCDHHVVCEVCNKELQWHPDVCPITQKPISNEVTDRTGILLNQSMSKILHYRGVE